MQIAGREFELSDDNEFGKTLLRWVGKVVPNAQAVASALAKDAENEGYHVYAATTEQQGCEDTFYPVVYLTPK